jgi:hypothetical protein
VDIRDIKGGQKAVLIKRVSKLVNFCGVEELVTIEAKTLVAVADVTQTDGDPIIEIEFLARSANGTSKLCSMTFTQSREYLSPVNDIHQTYSGHGDPAFTW